MTASPTDPPGSTGSPVELPVDRVRDRLSAYVYGNILVLSALATTTPSMVEDGHGVLLVLATTGTTYLAHVLAHLIGGAVDRDPSPETRREILHELRDAVPILSSGSLPALVLGTGWLTTLQPDVALVVASLVVVVRLASLGFIVGRLSGEPATRRQLLAGLLVAALGLVVVALKTFLLH